MWLKIGGTLLNLNLMSYIQKGYYFANSYDAKYGYDKNHQKPVIYIYKVNLADPFETLYFSKEEERDDFFSMIVENLQNEPNCIIEYDYLKYNNEQ